MQEDSYAFEHRKLKWMGQFNADDDVAEFLVAQSVSASFEIQHAERARMNTSTSWSRPRARRRLTAYLRLDSDCFSIAAPNGLYGNLPQYRTQRDQRLKTSTSGVADDPDHPAKLVAELEKTACGCHYLEAQWQALRAARAWKRVAIARSACRHSPAGTPAD